ncbi:hypothetical protein, partial [Sulfurimonas sp.]|uniref:hypothetical protein n=1 Tax=Sulfurimonas sp. TaxID=2022749 RepID=UPI0025E5C6AA
VILNKQVVILNKQAASLNKQVVILNLIQDPKARFHVKYQVTDKLFKMTMTPIKICLNGVGVI